MAAESYDAIIGTERVYPGLAHLPEPPDLALLAVPDATLAEQMIAAAEAGVRSVVMFGSAFDLHGNLSGRPSQSSRATPRCTCAARDAWGS